MLDSEKVLLALQLSQTLPGLKQYYDEAFDNERAKQADWNYACEFYPHKELVVDEAWREYQAATEEVVAIHNTYKNIQDMIERLNGESGGRAHG